MVKQTLNIINIRDIIMKINNKRGDMMEGRGKKGQAAMEFLMTYGWAILVVLIAIGALVYFGVLSPERFISDQCTLAAPLSCSRQGDFIATAGASTTALFKIQNGAGSSLSSVAVVVTPAGAASPCTTTGSTTIADGEKQEYSSTCPGSTAGDKLRYDLKVTYQVGTSGGYNQVSTGRLVVTAQA